MENRSTTNMGAAALVIEPDDVPGNNFLASVEWADDRPDNQESLHNGVFGVTRDQALELIDAAKERIFGSRGEAYDWLSRTFSAMSHYRPARKLAA